MWLCYFIDQPAFSAEIDGGIVVNMFVDCKIPFWQKRVMKMRLTLLKIDEQ
jgi:hypothetical protein